MNRDRSVQKIYRKEDDGRIHISDVCKELERANTEHENLYMTWMVPYEAGTITAKAWDKDGKEITENLQGRTSVTTAGEAKN